jgi:hypothetical protein
LLNLYPSTIALWPELFTVTETECPVSSAASKAGFLASFALKSALSAAEGVGYIYFYYYGKSIRVFGLELVAITEQAIVLER